MEEAAEPEPTAAADAEDPVAHDAEDRSLHDEGPATPNPDEEEDDAGSIDLLDPDQWPARQRS